jgi:RHS repeat-associated protein
VQTQYTFHPYGAVTAAGQSNGIRSVHGAENDGTGLYYYRARYYQPGLGRFVSEDPIGFESGDANFYGYTLSIQWNIARDAPS